MTREATKNDVFRCPDHLVGRTIYNNGLERKYRVTGVK